MIIKQMPFGEDPMDFNEETQADRIGQRIREIRIAQGKSQVSLGEEIGVSGSRIYKYENGDRKPKSNILKLIADALGVSTLALTDPVINNYFGMAYALFAMEKAYNMKYERSTDGRLSLVFGDGKTGRINEIIDELEKKRSSVDILLETVASKEERIAIEHEYDMWKWTYPHDDSRNSIDSEKERRRAELQAKRAQIDKELSELGEKLSDSDVN